MEYKIYVLNDDKLQDIGFDFNALQNIFASFNVEIPSFSMQKFDKLQISKILEEEKNLLIFMKNQEIDNIICENIKQLGNDKNIIEDQIVVFNKLERKIIFVPYDVNWINLLERVNLNAKRARKNCTFKMFGIYKKRIEEICESLKTQIDALEYSILSKGLLSNVYISYNGTDDLIDDSQVKIATAFKEFIYSENSLGLSESIFQLAKLKSLKLTICEGITGGAIIKDIAQNNDHIEEVLKSGKIEFLNSEINPDEVYKQTLTLFEKNSDNVFAINVQGEYLNDTLTCVYAIGDFKSIDVYKNTFKVKKNKAIEFAVDAIMFNIVKKLRQNNLSF